VTLAEQWREFEAGLPEDWSSVQLRLIVAQDDRADEASLMLASLTPGRRGDTFRIIVQRGKDPARVLGRLDDVGIRGRIDIVGAEKLQHAPDPELEHELAARAHPFASQWGDLTERLPSDWSDVYAEVELDSSDFVQRGALLLSPLNPAHFGEGTTLRFRIARSSGYGAAPSMAQRCFERLDEEHITGRLKFLRVLSATRHVATQGPVWRVGGRSV
jgi:hypothetical protein